MSAAFGARRAVAYIRSTESRPGLAQSSIEAPAAQRLAIEAWAERGRVDVTSWQVDLGIDGATPIAERPGLVAAYGAIRTQGAGILVAANAERFAHDELVCWLIERAALTEGAAIHTADGSRGPARAHAPAPRPTRLAHVGPAPSVDPDAQEASSWTRGAIALARAYDQVSVRARIRASVAERQARGERVGTVPYGQRLATDGIHLEVDPTEEAVIATVRRLAADGLSQRAIVTELGARGVSGRTGAPLGQTQVAKILRGLRAPDRAITPSL